MCGCVGLRVGEHVWGCVCVCVCVRWGKGLGEVDVWGYVCVCKIVEV